jgi:cytochrome P450
MTVVDRHELDFDHHNAEFRDHNKEVVARLHATGCPLAHSPNHGGYWAIYGYDAVYDAVQDAELFSSVHTAEHPKGAPAAPYVNPLVPIDFDGPMVKEFRRVALGTFSPTGAQDDLPRIRAICDDLIDSFIETGRADLSHDLFTPLPARWVLGSLGWDVDRWPEWIEWVHAMVHDGISDPDRAVWGGEMLFSEAMKELEARRENPTDDLFSEIVNSRPGGQPMTDEQIVGYASLVVIGGMDTTAGLTGNVIEYLDAHPEIRQRLIDEPELLPRATEEFLRLQSPSYGLYRRVTRDAEFHGQQLRKDDIAMLMFPAAGLDPAVFDNPNEADFDRTGNRHMAFGLGAHRCLGSHHARVMFQIMLTQVLERMPDFRISGPVERFHDSGPVYAIRHLPVEFTPGPKVGA